ncbi:MAG: class I SAM-dependent RNA methyltransferase [Myxococcaceae bacterium]
MERLGLEGEGIATHQGRALFIPGAFPGERVRTRLEPAANVLRGRLEAVLEPSPERRVPECPLADRCGGCDWMQLSPAAQVLEKQRLVLDALTRIGRLPSGSFDVLATAGLGTDSGTRRRAVLHKAAAGLGYYGRRSHAPVEVERCPALVSALAPLPGRLAPLVRPLGHALRAIHLLAEGDCVSLALALDGPVRSRSKEAAAALVRSGMAQGVVLLEPEGRTEDVGKPVLEATAPGRPEVHVRLRPEAFAQAHSTGASVLVDRGLELLAPRAEDRALELYAGNGTFTFALAARVASVVAVESLPVSVALASSAARAGKVDNIRWVQGEASRVSEGLLREGARFDVLLADPPRTGAPTLARLARDLGVRRVLYVGCDAGSLARDAGRLVEVGFRLETVQLVDLFPNTHHVEALLAFSSRPSAPPPRGE